MTSKFILNAVNRINEVYDNMLMTLVSTYISYKWKELSYEELNKEHIDIKE